MSRISWQPATAVCPQKALSGGVAEQCLFALPLFSFCFVRSARVLCTHSGPCSVPVTKADITLGSERNILPQILVPTTSGETPQTISIVEALRGGEL